MNKLKFLLIAAFAAATVASCSKEDNPGGKDKAGIDGDIRMTISYGQDVETRGLSWLSKDSITHVNLIAVYMTNSTGEILRSEFSYGDMPYINIDELLSQGVTFRGLSGVEEVHVFANARIDRSLTYANIGDVRSKNSIVLNEQRDSKYFIHNVAMFGNSSDIEPIGSSTTEFEVDVEITPLLSRVELGGFKAVPTEPEDPQDTPVVLEDGYLVSGIFMTDYYTKMALNGLVADADYVDLGQDPDDYALTPGGELLSTDNGWLFDLGGKSVTIGSKTYNVIGQAGSGDNNPKEFIAPEWVNPEDATDKAPQAWGYNFIPSSEAANYYVIKLENVEDEDGLIVHYEEDGVTKIPGSVDGTGYLWIKYFYDDDTGRRIDNFKPGWAYYVKLIEFNRDHISHAPKTDGGDEKALTVSVKVVKWEQQKAGVGLGKN